MSTPSKHYESLISSLKDQSGKIIAITGTTSGTGLAAAKACVRLGATVILLNRESPRVDQSIDELKGVTEDESRIVKIPCDLQDFESVKKAAEMISEQFPDGIDVLCNNAGIGSSDKQVTVDGYEITMQTNHFSHFLLTLQLLPVLEKKSGRVVNHSSIAANVPVSPLNEVFYKKLSEEEKVFVGNAGQAERYHQTKLANCLFTIALEKRLKQKESKVSVYVAHPGISLTSIQDNPGRSISWALETFLTCMRQSAEDGSHGIVRCMLDDTVEPGVMYGPKRFTGKAVKQKYGKLVTFEAAEQLWKLSEEACDVKFEV